MEKGKCPLCKEIIDYLEFCNDITQYGTEDGNCDLTGDNKEYGDTDIHDSECNDTRYACPKCREQIFISDIEEIEEEEEEIELNEDGKPIKKKEESKDDIKFVTTAPYAYATMSGGVESLICHECGHEKNPIGPQELSVFCIKCGAELIKDKAKAISFGNNY